MFGDALQNGVGVGIGNIPSLTSLPYSQQLRLAVASLFSGGAQGYWFDNSRLDTIFQDASGTIPGALEAPVGLQLDLSQGLAVGPELVGDPTFSNPGYWNAGAGWSITGNAAVATSATAGVTKAGLLTAGKWYVATITVNRTSGTVNLPWDSTPAFDKVVGASGTYTRYFLASITTLYATYAASNFTGSVTNISVKQILGNHRSQSTSANRPTLSALYNLLTQTNTFGGDWSVTSGTVSASAVLSPDGVTNMRSFVPAAASSVHQIDYGASKTIAGSSAVHNIYVKANGYTKVAIRENASSGAYASFDLSAVSLLASSGVTGTPTINLVSNGIYRIRMQVDGNASQRLAVFVLAPSYTTGTPFVTWTPDGTSGIYVWGADLRPSDQATGLIPQYQRVDTVSAGGYDTVGFPVYIKYNGSNQFLSTAAIDLTGTNKVTVFAGVRKLAESPSYQIIAELSDSTKAGCFSLHGTGDGTAGGAYAAALKGASAAAAVKFGTFPAPATSVLSSSYDLSTTPITTQITSQINGVTQTETIVTAGPTGAGNFGSYPVFFGMRNGASLPFSGYEYSDIMVGSSVTAGQLAATTAYTNALTRAY